LLFKPPMIRTVPLLLVSILLAANAFAQDQFEPIITQSSPTPRTSPPTATAAPPAATAAPPAATSTPAVVTEKPPKRSLFGRILHPFGGSSAPRVPVPKDPKLRGLTVEVQVSPQPLKLSEIRQLEVKAILKSDAKNAIALDFPTDQRIEIFLINSDGTLLTKWSDNHAINDKKGTVTINPLEHIEYNERIATRDLTPNKVFTAEVFFPKYPELRARQKFMTEP
jgi:hypothetical protein